MTEVLISIENVYVISNDYIEKKGTWSLLFDDKAIDFSKTLIKSHETDYVWVRDNGPIYIHEDKGNLAMLDWGFNGWGKKFKYRQPPGAWDRIIARTSLGRVNKDD